MIIAQMMWLPLSIYGIEVANKERKYGDYDDATLDSGDSQYLLSLEIMVMEEVAIIAFSLCSYPVNVYLISKMFDDSSASSKYLAMVYTFMPMAMSTREDGSTNCSQGMEYSVILPMTISMMEDF